MGMDLTALNDYLYTYRMSLPENTKKCKLSLSNSLWLRDIFRVDDAFLDTCANYYGAEAYRSAFDDSLVTDLNRWVDNKTDGMISSLLDQPPTDRTMLYLVNAVCFDAKWREPSRNPTLRRVPPSPPPTAHDRRRTCCGPRRAFTCPTTTPPAS